MTEEELKVFEKEHLDHAREKHPYFADGPKEVIFLALCELGEAAQEVAKKGPCWEVNYKSEMLDAIAILERGCLDDDKAEAAK